MICTHNYIPMPWTATNAFVQLSQASRLLHRSKHLRTKKSVQLRGVPFSFLLFPFLSCSLHVCLPSTSACCLLMRLLGLLMERSAKFVRRGKKERIFSFLFPFLSLSPFCTKLCVTRNHGEKQVTLQPAL